MKSYKAAISLITRKRLFSETTQSLFSHNPFKGNTDCLFAEDLAALLTASVWYRYESKSFPGTEVRLWEMKTTFRANFEDQVGQNPAKVSFGSDLLQNSLLRAQVCNT